MMNNITCIITLTWWASLDAAQQTAAANAEASIQLQQNLDPPRWIQHTASTKA